MRSGDKDLKGREEKNVEICLLGVGAWQIGGAKARDGVNMGWMAAFPLNGKPDLFLLVVLNDGNFAAPCVLSVPLSRQLCAGVPSRRPKFPEKKLFPLIPTRFFTRSWISGECAQHCSIADKNAVVGFWNLRVEMKRENNGNCNLATMMTYFTQGVHTSTLKGFVSPHASQRIAMTKPTKIALFCTDLKKPPRLVISRYPFCTTHHASRRHVKKPN